jgi:arylsulfatase
LIIALAVGLSLLLLTAARQASERNVILITVDTLRADHLGVYGYARNTSPNLDRFAKEGILFRHAFSHAPETNPSFSSLMTSHYPHETKVLHNGYILPPRAVTMAEILKANGYRTSAVVSNPTLRRGSGFEQGFDDYDDQTELQDRVRGRKERTAPRTTRAAIKWLEENSKKKFFLWVHYMDPHGPYTAPSPYDTMFVEHSTGGTRVLPINEGRNGKAGIPSYQQLGDHRDPAYYISQYDGEIRFFDHAFGELIQKIHKLGLLNNSLIVFSADHGEGMGEHDYYFAHREFVYNGLIHVPLIIRLPGQSSDVKEIRYPVAHVDLLPTVLDTLSINSSQMFRGKNLFRQDTERDIFSETRSEGLRYALIRTGIKLIRSESNHELYDLHNDFAETTNLMNGEMTAAVSTRVADLKRKLDAIRQQDALALGNPIRRSRDAEMRKKLRALGYVQ